MIKVVVKKLRIKKGDPLGEVTNVLRNAAAEGFADKCRKHLKGIECSEDHPTALTVIITADKKKTMTVRKTAYCCKKFSDSIQIEIDR